MPQHFRFARLAILGSFACSAMALAQTVLPRPPLTHDTPTPATPNPAHDSMQGQRPAPTPAVPPSGGAHVTKQGQPWGGTPPEHVQVDGSTYTVSPNRPAGSSIPGDAESNTVTPSMWTVKRFGRGADKKVEETPADSQNVPAPAPIP